MIRSWTRWGGRGLLAGAVLAGAASLASVSLATSVSRRQVTLRVTTARDGFHLRRGQCSLRDAIATVNSPGRRTACGRAGRSSNRIVLRAGRYRLTLHASGRDGDATGDLNVTSAVPLTIVGAGRLATVITASGLRDRVFSVAHGASVTLRDATVTGGRLPRAAAGAGGASKSSCSAGGAGGSGADAQNGGGISNAGNLTLVDVALIGNEAGSGGTGGMGAAQAAAAGCGGGHGGAGGNGGGIYNEGRLTLKFVSVSGDQAGAGGAGGPGGTGGAGAGGAGGSGGPGGSGGGIYNGGRLVVTAAILREDSAGRGGNGGHGAGGTLGPGVAGAGGLGAPGGGIATSHGPLRIVNSTLVGDFAGAGGAGGGSGGHAGADTGSAGHGGAGGSGGALQTSNAPSKLLNVTLADNGVGSGGPGGSAGRTRGPSGLGGDLSVQASSVADELKLQNSIVASSSGSGCAKNRASAISYGGHDLVHRANGCPGAKGNPRLERPKYNGGPTETMALMRGSAAIDRIPKSGARCPHTDQRGVLRPQGSGCDVGAYEVARPVIEIIAPRPRGSYERGTRVHARFRCSEGGIHSPVASCTGTVRRDHAIDTRSVGRQRFKVTAVDKSGHRVTKIVRYRVWAYANPMRAVSSLQRGRIDMGVDYAGSGPVLALGAGKVTMASDHDSGPLRCWGRTCWPGGGVVVYQLTDGPFAGKYVYVAENITVSVSAGERVRAGQRIAIVHDSYPDMETGWGSGRGPETLAIADHHQCTCVDPGGWSSIEGRNLNQLLVRLGAPSGYLQASVPAQQMPRGWPRWPSRRGGRGIRGQLSALAERVPALFGETP